MENFIKELKEINLENMSGFSSDYLVRNTFKIGQLFHKYKMSKYLKDTKTLSKFILNHIKKEDNIKLWMYGNYYLKEYKWLLSVLRTVYKRPDIEFLYRPLYYPEMKTAKQFKQIIGSFKFVINSKIRCNLIDEKDNFYCLFDACYEPHRKYEQQIEHTNKFASFYLYLTDEFKQKILNNDFDVITTWSLLKQTSIELFKHNNGMTLGVLHAEIGERYLFYIPTKEIEKLYKEGIKKENIINI